MSVLKYNVTTIDGLALIAQATSSNPIIIVKSVTSANAASSESDLTTKGVSFYDGAEGVIQSSSASGNRATIVAKYTNTGSTRQLVKSVAILARLQSQSAGQEVVLAAQSDPDSTIELPSIYDYAQKVFFQFNISFNAAGSVETTPDGCASIEDLDRMVSCHLAGQPTVGEEQEIYGRKWLKDDVYMQQNLYPHRIVCGSGGMDMNGATLNINNGGALKGLEPIDSGDTASDNLPIINIEIGGIIAIWQDAYYSTFPRYPVGNVLYIGTSTQITFFTVDILNGVIQKGQEHICTGTFVALTGQQNSTSGSWGLYIKIDEYTG